MTDMKKRFYKRKANTIRKGRKVTLSTACKRLAENFIKLREAMP